MAAAFSIVSTSVTSIAASFAASGRLGVTRKADGNSLLTTTPTASSSISGAPCLLTMTGSITKGNEKRSARSASASITGAFVAFVDACAVMKKNGLCKKMPFADLLAATSVGVVMSEELLDLNYKEDSSAAVDMNVVMTASGRIIEVQSTAEGAPFTRNRFNNLLDMAHKGITQITATMKDTLADVL